MKLGLRKKSVRVALICITSGLSLAGITYFGLYLLGGLHSPSAIEAGTAGSSASHGWIQDFEVDLSQESKGFTNSIHPDLEGDHGRFNVSGKIKSHYVKDDKSGQKFVLSEVQSIQTIRFGSEEIPTSMFTNQPVLIVLNADGKPTEFYTSNLSGENQIFVGFFRALLFQQHVVHAPQVKSAPIENGKVWTAGANLNEQGYENQFKVTGKTQVSNNEVYEIERMLVKSSSPESNFNTSAVVLPKFTLSWQGKLVAAQGIVLDAKSTLNLSNFHNGTLISENITKFLLGPSRLSPATQGQFDSFLAKKSDLLAHGMKHSAGLFPTSIELNQKLAHGHELKNVLKDFLSAVRGQGDLDVNSLRVMLIALLNTHQLTAEEMDLLKRTVLASGPHSMEYIEITSAITRADTVQSQKLIMEIVDQMREKYPATPQDVLSLLSHISHFSEPSHSVLSYLRDLRHDTDLAFRNGADLILGSVAGKVKASNPGMAMEITQELMKDFRSKPGKVHYLKALANTGSDAIFPDVSRMIASDQPEMRFYAVKALKNVTSSPAQDLLIKTVETESDQILRTIALNSLGNHPLNERILKLYKDKYFQEQNPGVKKEILNNVAYQVLPMSEVEAKEFFKLVMEKEEDVGLKGFAANYL
jgi:hypothetical protein